MSFITIYFGEGSALVSQEAVGILKQNKKKKGREYSQVQSKDYSFESSNVCDACG